MDEDETYTPRTDIDPDNLAHRWIMGRVRTVVAGMDDDFSKYRLNEALKKIYSLIWDDFCDWFIEISKADKPGESIPKENLERALGFFELLMKMLHPFMPFITEEIWQRISERKPEEALTISDWPESEGDTFDPSVELFGTIQAQISAIRNIQAEMNLSPKAELSILIKPDKKELQEKLSEAEWIYRKLLPVKSITFNTDAIKPTASAASVVDGTEIYVPLEGLIDLEKERKRIQKEIEKMQGYLKSTEKKLANEKFVQNAPDEIVEKERQKKKDAESNLEKLKKQLMEFEG
jgi:valyl-tRNA synthetase